MNKYNVMGKAYLMGEGGNQMGQVRRVHVIKTC